MASKNPLIKLEKISKELEACKTPQEAKDIADKAAAAEIYARKAKLGLKIQNDAAEAKIRSERRCGELLSQLRRGHAGRKGSKGNCGNVAAISGSEYQQTLVSMDTDPREARRWQQVAEVPQKDFEAHVKVTRNEGRELTTSGVIKECRKEQKKKRKKEIIDMIANEPQPLPKGPFRVITIDPPWKYDTRLEKSELRGLCPYPEMDLDAIIALPIPERAAADCVLWLWTTNAMMPAACACIDAWSFEFKTILTWDKEKIGVGHWLRNQTEHCILATKGKPKVNLKSQSTIIREKPGKHSSKPEKFYKLVDSLCVGSKLEMFARAEREGWMQWGSGEED